MTHPHSHPSAHGLPGSPRTPESTSVESTHMVLPPDTNAHGTAFGGKIMQWMDVTASISAGRHVGGPVVTASADHLDFTRPIRMGDVVILKARVNYVGTTSMEIGVRVEREDARTRHREHCLTGYFTFVAVDSNGRPMSVPPITPVTPDDQRRYDKAKQRRELRLKLRASP